MADLHELVVGSPEWYRPLEQAILAAHSRVEVAERLRSFVSSHLGEIEEALFYRAGVGLVVGLRLVGGEEIVLKVHRHNVSIPRLEAVQRVQSSVADAWLAAPRPLLPATQLDRGIATVEELRHGDGADGRLPAVRRSLADGLYRFVRHASSVQDVDDIGDASAVQPVSEDLWGEPHDLRFDFDATSAGAEWIDRLARLARHRLCQHLPRVTGHLDWRVENLGFSGTDIVAIYDWDSLTRAPEPVVVGQAAGGFSSDWRVGPQTLPTVDDMAAFVQDYELVRGTPFDDLERDVLDAANLLLCAYGARCQHSDQVLFGLGDSATGGWLRLLEDRVDHGLLGRP